MKKFSKKAIPFKLLLMIIVAVAVIGVGSTYAILTVGTNTLSNSFETKGIKIDTEIKEETNGTTKKAIVYNQNTSPVLIRAKIVISPEDVAAANVLTQQYRYGDTQKIGTDTYSVAAGNWVKDGEWYYYLGVVPEGYSTGLLMDHWSPLPGANYEGNLDIYIYEESVQTTVNAEVTLTAIKDAFSSAVK